MRGFAHAVNRTLGYEGHYHYDPADPGGETNWGISKRAYPELDIRNLTRDEATEVYRRDYWDRLSLDELDADVSAEIFDTAVNLGVTPAVRIAQRAANALTEGRSITMDGRMGPATIGALRAATDRDKTVLLVTLNSLQCARYVELCEREPWRRRWYRGWVRQRVQLEPR